MKQEVKIKIDSILLEGSLIVPADASGIIVFAHGSGSSRFSPRNMFVAEKLREAGMGTMLIDLLTEKEDKVYERRFDIDLLAKRLLKVVSWLTGKSQTKDLPIAIFGASTGAAAALKAAAQYGDRIASLVSRGGRPDLAMESLNKVTSPTLLIVGGNDFDIIELNKKALAVLVCEKKLEIVPEATHLFEEPGTLEEVARLSSAWFQQYFLSKSYEKAT